MSTTEHSNENLGLYLPINYFACKVLNSLPLLRFVNFISLKLN